MSSQTGFMKTFTRVFVVFLAAPFSLSQTEAAMARQAAASPAPDNQTVAARADRSSVARATRSKRDLWFPPEKDIDRDIPPVTEGVACPLDRVLSETGKRIEELIHNVDRFTATEVVEHQSVNRSGRLGRPEVRQFNYLVTMAQRPSGYVNVDEYRNGGSAPDQFPEHIATVGTPSLVLIFQTNNLKNFQMTCEGLGLWHEQAAWQVRFEERRESRNRMSVVELAGGNFGLRLRGRAWILDGSYQVARMESDLADEIPKLRLHLQHQEIEYRPVPLPDAKGLIWLPATTQLYMDFLGHRFYRRHTFTNVKFFSVKVQQTFGDPRE
jgi:hypothetical protein